MQKRHDQTASLIGKSAAAFGLVWLVWAAVCLAGTAGLVYVAWHFVSKFW